MTSDMEALREIARAHDWEFCTVCNKPVHLDRFMGEPGRPWYAGRRGVKLSEQEAYCKGCVLSSYDYLRGDSDQWRGRNYREWVEVVLRWITSGLGPEPASLPHWESTWFQDEVRRRAK